jgi:hypothetical protein
MDSSLRANNCSPGTNTPFASRKSPRTWWCGEKEGIDVITMIVVVEVVEVVLVLFSGAADGMLITCWISMGQGLCSTAIQER